MGREMKLKKEWIDFGLNYMKEHPETNFMDLQDEIYKEFFKGKFVKDPWFTTKCIADEVWRLKDVGG